MGSAKKSAATYRAALAKISETELADRFVADTLEVPRAVAALTKMPGNSGVAWRLLERLGGLAFRPLFEAGPPAPKTCRRYLDLLVRLALELRTQASGVFIKLLEDKRDMPLASTPEEGPPPEELPRKRRVCDQAYVAPSKLAHYPQVTRQLEIERDFLHCSAAVKDAVIARGKQTEKWDGPTEQEINAN